MGNNQVRFDEETIRELEETTPFNRAEIEHTFGVFSELYSKQSSTTNLTTPDGLANPDCEVSVETIKEHFPQLKCNPFKAQICLTFCTSDSENMQFVEFLDMVSSFSPKADLEKKIFHAFQIFDFDRDGLISRDDLNNMIEMMTQDEEDTDEDRRDDNAQWIATKEWLVNGIFRECHKGVSMDNNHLTSSSHLNSTGQQIPNQPQHELSLVPEPNNTMLAATPGAAMSLNESLTIEDFRYCIYRSPDFINTFSFNL